MRWIVVAWLSALRVDALAAGPEVSGSAPLATPSPSGVGAPDAPPGPAGPPQTAPSIPAGALNSGLPPALPSLGGSIAPPASTGFVSGAGLPPSTATGAIDPAQKKMLQERGYWDLMFPDGDAPNAPAAP